MPLQGRERRKASEPGSMGKTTWRFKAAGAGLAGSAAIRPYWAPPVCQEPCRRSRR